MVDNWIKQLKAKEIKLRQPDKYNQILEYCIQFQDGVITEGELLETLLQMRVNYRQLIHIMEQAKELTGKNTSLGGLNNESFITA